MFLASRLDRSSYFRRSQNERPRTQPQSRKTACWIVVPPQESLDQSFKKACFHGHKGSVVPASHAPSSERGLVSTKLSLTKSRSNNLRQLARAVRHRSQRQIMQVEQHGKIANCLSCFVAATDTDPEAQANTMAKTYEQRTSLSAGADDSDRKLSRSLQLRSRNPDQPSLAKQTCRSPPDALDGCGILVTVHAKNDSWPVERQTLLLELASI